MVGERELPICADFRSMLQIDALLTADLMEEERGEQILHLFYGCVPEDISAAAGAMLWFFRCGAEADEESKNSSASPAAPDFSYQADASLIYAAFLDQYGIDLMLENVHWWRFRALFDALKPDHVFSEVRRCRCVRLDDVPKEQRPYYKAMKKLYALPHPQSERDKLEAVTAALMGDGNVREVLNGFEENES